MTNKRDKQNMTTLKVTIVPLLCVLFTGCDMVDSQMLQQLQEYFPLVKLSHPQPGVLLVDTHLANLTEKFAQVTTGTLLREHCCHGGIGGLASYDLDQILPAAGYHQLAIAFDQAMCIYNPPQTEFFICAARAQANIVGPLHRYPINAPSNLFQPIEPIEPMEPMQPIPLQPIRPIKHN